MKKFSKFFIKEENIGNAGVLGVTNHYTPVENIVTFLNNVFCVRLSIVAMKGEDGLSVKLTSSKFTSEKAVDELLYWNLNDQAANYNESNMYSYITSCGLTKVNKINIGGYWIVYFSPADIAGASQVQTISQDCCPCPVEACESLNNEFEMDSIIKEDDDEEEMKSQTVEKVLALLDGPDKVKAAKQLELLVSNEIQLPREFYFSAIKFKSGEEAIALRWKYTKKMPFGKAEGEDDYKETTVENTRSIMHIFGKGKKAIWVQDFDKESLIKLPDDVKKLIESILDLLEASKTDDPAIYGLTGERKEREDKDEDKDKDKDKDKEKDKDSEEKDDEKKSEDKDKDEDDSEDDDSRGESDNLLGM